MVHAVYDRDLSLWRVTSTEKTSRWHPLLDRMGYMHRLPHHAKRTLCFAPEEAAWLHEAGHLSLDEPVTSVLQQSWTTEERDMWPYRWAVYNRLRSSGWFLLPHRAHLTRQSSQEAPHQSVFRRGAPCVPTPHLFDTCKGTLWYWVRWLRTSTWHLWRGLLYRLLLFPLFRTTLMHLLVCSKTLKSKSRPIQSYMALPSVQATAVECGLLSSLSAV